MAAHTLDAAVTDLMRHVARTIVLPRHRALAEGEVMEKAPGDLVTVADRLAEEALTAGLLALLPGSRVVGEEAVAADPALRDTIGDGMVWVVDPIDGTHNYADGEGAFAIMVAVVEDGVTQAGWILEPVTDRIAHAQRGGGAFVDGRAVRLGGTGRTPPVAAFANQYLPADLRERFAPRIAGRFEDVAPPRCAGEQYARILLGRNDLALFWNAFPWDHAPGALLLAEAGGRVAGLDGADYTVARTERGLIAAASPELWAQAAALLRDPAP